MGAGRFKVPLLAAAMLASMAFLVVVGMSRPGGVAYYLSVGEYLARESRALEEGFRVNGKVLAGTIERLPGGEDVRFTMIDPAGGAQLPVAYHGIVPDTFVDGAEVVVEGGVDERGVFRAHKLLAKCPSKYEAADGYEEPAPAAGITG